MKSCHRERTQLNDVCVSLGRPAGKQHHGAFVCLLIMIMVCCSQELRSAAVGSLQRLAKHVAVSFKNENPTEVLSSVHDMLVEVAAALPKM